MPEAQQARRAPEAVGIVAIGRNEGERLRSCLVSARKQVETVVYVDSGSTDGSLQLAAELGCEVVQLDLSVPFTAARARNAGFDRLLSIAPGIVCVQFVDGDCEIENGWIAAAQDALRERPEVVAVFGRRRERFPGATIYNRMCDLEWSVPAGETRSCGGDVMMRVAALRQAGGYRGDMIAGEEPELCVRLRRAGGKIRCLAVPMTIHDAAIARFGQWWRRTIRSGYAYANGAALHGGPPEFHNVRESRRNWFWGLLLPVAAVAGMVVVGPAASVLLLAYPAQVARLYLKRRQSMPIPLVASTLQVVGRFAEVYGQLWYHYRRQAGQAGRLIEYR